MTRKLAAHYTLAQALDTFYLTLEMENRAEATRYYHRLVGGRFAQFLGTQGYGDDPSLAALTTPNARAFILWVKQDHQTTNLISGRAYHKGPKTILEHVRSLKAFSAFCVREEMLATDPLAALKAPKVPSKLVATFTPEHLRALVAVIDRHPYADRNRALLYFLLSTGVRVSELCSLQRGDLDLKQQRARVWGKGSKEREVQFDPATAKLLIRYLAGRSGDSPYVFLNRFGRPLTRFAVAGLMREFGQEAGITDEVRCSPHTLRHTHAVAFLEAHPGALFHLQAQLGHSDLAMTRRYAQVAKGREHLDGPGVVDTLGLTTLALRRPVPRGSR